MATTEQVMDAATKVGQLVSEHEAAKRLQDVLDRLENDPDAQRTLVDHNRQAETLIQKQQQGQPIEVDDKRKLDELQQKVARNPLLQQLQQAQMDYVDLLRKVDEQIAGSSPVEQPQPPAH